jgi:glutamine synthetase
VFTTVGAEQEYFLIDEQYYYERPDLINTGRTLFGASRRRATSSTTTTSARSRAVLACMLETTRAASSACRSRPATTRSPAQYEIAPIFENSNVGSDHQQLTMQVLQNVARRYGLVCLLHEKPFAGVKRLGQAQQLVLGHRHRLNCSTPGDDPATNLDVPVLLRRGHLASDKHQALLRASVANAARTTASARTRRRRRSSRSSSAPSSSGVLAIESGSGDAATPSSYLKLGASVLPHLPMHGGDRNRTSPFAFTGNKFEFRALGSSMSCGFPNTVLNTIAAQAIDRMSDALEAQLEGGAELAEAVLAVVKESYVAHKRIVFNGDNYTEDWHAEAEQRGLANLPQTPDALPALVSPEAVEVMSAYDVLSERELDARYEVFVEQYIAKLNIEAETTFSMAKTMLLPAAIRYLGELGVAGSSKGIEAIRSEIASLVDAFVERIGALELANTRHPAADDVLERARYVQRDVVPAMSAVREVADKLERSVPDSLWPLPKYSEILFIK